MDSVPAGAAFTVFPWNSRQRCSRDGHYERGGHRWIARDHRYKARGRLSVCGGGHGLFRRPLFVSAGCCTDKTDRHGSRYSSLWLPSCRLPADCPQYTDGPGTLSPAAVAMKIRRAPASPWPSMTSFPASSSAAVPVVAVNHFFPIFRHVYRKNCLILQHLGPVCPSSPAGQEPLPVS